MIIGGFKKAFKYVLLIICFAFILVGFTGCQYKGYSGKRVDLFTAAVNSILWNHGYSFLSDRITSPELKIIEEDEYGRTLFTYYERWYSNLTFSSLIISQGNLDGEVYYYEDCNFLIKQQERYTSNLLPFSQEEIEYLKDLNDWGKEVDFQKCVKKKIDKRKQSLPVDKKIIVDKVVVQFNLTDKRYSSYADYYTSDIKGNYIIYGSAERYSENEYIFFAAMLTPDNEIIDWFVPADPYNYQEEFKIFKDKNGWSN